MRRGGCTNWLVAGRARCFYQVRSGPGAGATILPSTNTYIYASKAAIKSAPQAIFYLKNGKLVNLEISKECLNTVFDIFYRTHILYVFNFLKFNLKITRQKIFQAVCFSFETWSKTKNSLPLCYWFFSDG